MKAKNKGICCLTLLAFFAGIGHTCHAKADSTVFTAVERLVSGPRADAKSSYARARAAAWLNALDKAAESLPVRHNLLLFELDRNDRRALAAQIYAVAVQPAEPRPTLPHAVVILQPRQSLSEDTILALHNPELSRFWRAIIEETGLALQTTPANETTANGSLGGPVKGAAGLSDSQADTLEGLWQVKEVIGPTSGGMFVSAEALSLLEKAARLAPQSPAVRLALAEAQLQRNLPEQCAQSCDEALNLKPDLYRARYIRALALMRLGRLALAEDDLNALMTTGLPATGKETAGRLRTRGAVRFLRGNYGGMCEDFAGACALGDCEGLAEARDKGHCLKSAESP
ncbi:MAG: tetratricopeptide repeat protein [Desulfovibrio sp.]|nr:tetratricopeptide repeat protein [Desulfovibrio sp.]